MSDLEKLFFKIDKQVEEAKGQGLYFEALTKYLTLENNDDYFDIVDNYDKETIRKVYQFLLLKALKELNNPSYDITPEVITMYVSHLIECIYGEKKISIADFASGFRVIIMTQANSQVNTRVLELLPKFKIKKMNRWCAV